MIIIKLKDIQQKFDDLVSGNVAREDIADYAASLMQADDNGLLTIEPDSEREKLWRCILYLSGVDLKDSPNTYLHVVEDFIEYRKANGL